MVREAAADATGAISGWELASISALDRGAATRSVFVLDKDVDRVRFGLDAAPGRGRRATIDWLTFDD